VDLNSLQVAGIDFLGRDVIRGYGSALIPLSAGHHILDVPMYTPLSSSIVTEWAAWLWGNPPEVTLSPFLSFDLQSHAGVVL
jgi:B9 domain-containing protein 1